jgi:hypothetical protein
MLRNHPYTQRKFLTRVVQFNMGFFCSVWGYIQYVCKKYSMKFANQMRFVSITVRLVLVMAACTVYCLLF